MKWVLSSAVLLILSATVTVAQQLVIKGQRELQVEQGQPITITLSDITVEADKAHNYPAGFYLEIDDGPNYSVSGTTITPDPAFTGKLKVKILVTNGQAKSKKFKLEIKVLKSGGGEDDDDGDDDDGDDDDDDDDGDDDDGDDDDGGGDDDDGDGGSGDSNYKPVIVSQVTVQINKNQSLTLQLSHLVVTDDDNDYPEDFKLKLESGNNYTVSETTITPAEDFVGNLTIKVKVNDGREDSDAFDFKVNVKEDAPVNVEPVITAHTSLSTFKNESITLRLTDLSVTDPDDSYPSGFTLTIVAGSNYTVSGHAVTPVSGMLGTITVKVKVNDGTDDSNIFDVKINVIERGRLEILSQAPIIIPEDSSYLFKLADLRVSDPSGTYPSGFTLTVLDGENYTIDGNIVRPAANFNGNLNVPVKVSKGEASSNVFQGLVMVRAVNDPPTFSTFDTTPIPIGEGPVDFAISTEVVAADIDNERLSFASVELDSADVTASLGYINTENIRGVFDRTNGLLVLIGDATLAEYTEALKRISYSSNDSIRRERTIAFRLNDGEAYSLRYEKKLIMLNTEIRLDIPTAFTPNNDNANDTWQIALMQLAPQAQVDLKIYNQRGLLLFESNSFERQWDGRFNGELLPADRYYYTIVIKTGNKEEFRKGIVAILR